MAPLESGAGETLGMQPAGEQSELLMYTSCRLETTFFELRNEDRNRRLRKRGRQLPTHTYQEDTGRRTLERDFLGGGSVPSRLDEDAPAVTAMMIRSTNAGIMLTPFLLGHKLPARGRVA
jgi:hypothetical protein